MANQSKTLRNKNGKGSQRREQPRKDSRSKKINFDNERDSKFMKDIESETRKTSKSNDVGWYARNPEMLRAAASLPFSTTVGMPVGWDSGARIPGLMTLRWIPLLGGANAVPLNAAANSIYSYVVHANSRNYRYNAPDLMLLIVAGANLFSWLAHGIRAYGIARNYDQTNAYTPDILLRGMGFDPDDIRANLSQMWFDLNEMIARSSQIWIPNDLPFIERWFWLNSNVYMDASGTKAQYYMFRPEDYLVYNEKTESTGGFLQYKRYAGDGTKSGTWERFRDVINEMFDALLESEDRGIIFGDILKAYGADKIYALKPIPSDYRVIPVYDPEVLTQIENATCMNVNPLQLKQDPDTNRLWNNFGSFATGTNLLANVHLPVGTILNFHTPEVPTPAQIMVATRLTALGTDFVLDSNNKVVGTAPYTCGTEYIQDIDIAYLDSSTQGYTFFTVTPKKGAAAQAYFGEFALYNAFDWAPAWPCYNFTDIKVGESVPSKGLRDCTLERTVMDIDQYAWLDVDVVSKMHLSALYSELGVPTV